jgi:hypothetical protein
MKRGVFGVFAVWCIALATAGTQPRPAKAGGYAADLGAGKAGLSRFSRTDEQSGFGGISNPALDLTSGRVLAQSQTPAAQPPSSHATLLTQYCLTCHNEHARTGGFVLSSADLTDIPAHADVWEKVVRKVRAGMMPPAGAPRPAQASLDAFVTHLETTIDKAALTSPSLRRATMHRLNRSEYANAIRDLFDLQVDVASLLPPDEEAYGFDNNALVLGISPTLMERYLSAAWKISSLVVASPKITPTLDTFRVPGDLSQHDHVAGLPIGTRGGIVFRHYFPVDGEYVISPRLYRETVNIIRGLELPHDLEMTVDGERVVLARFGGPADEQANYLQPTLAGDEMERRFQKRLKIAAGTHTIGVAFLKKSSATTIELLQPFERERLDPITPVGIPELDRVTVEGPFNASPTAVSPSRTRVFICRPAAAGQPPGADRACASRILSALARRAYRGQVVESEMTRLLGFYDKERAGGGSFDAGIESAITFLLVNPRFLFRVERDPDIVAAGTSYRINDLELASRLSFFIWSSIPDDELLDVAAAGKLRQAAVLEQQVRRMLKDERARALGANFAGQWLYLRNLRALHPDADVFPDFDHNLREALQRETEMLFESLVLEDKSVLRLLDADYTFLNERLARHYGVPNVYGTQYRRVPVTNGARRGLLGHGSILALTSYPNRTSPVNRGKYVLTNILGTPPPAPPENVPPLDETPGKARTMRDRMEEHRRNPACAGCHKLMDPIGIALENFDGIGRWRTADAGLAIDPAAQLADGSNVAGPADLRAAILRRPELFARNMTEMLLTYALGHGLEHHDMPYVRGILKEAARTEYRFSSLVLGIVKSVPFQMRRAE